MASEKPQTRPSVRHPSHNHPLRGHKAQVDDEIICSGCDLDLIGAAYKCTKSECDYFLHKSCFELPREVHHKSHLDHPLTLLYFPPNDHSTYTCNACGEYGSGFTYNCSICQYDFHVGCVSMPESMKHDEHVHPLTLVYSFPRPKGLIVTCDVCHETIPQNLWSYFCQLCNYNTHLHSCVADEEEEPCVVADEEEQPCAADEDQEEPCVDDEEEEPHNEGRIRKRDIIILGARNMVTTILGHVADEEEEPCIVADEEEKPCLVDDKEEEQCVANEEEEPEKEGRTRKRDIILGATNIVTTVLGFGPVWE